MSVAGGLFNALDSAAALNMKTCQVFTKNASQWKASPLKDEDVDRFKTSWDTTGIHEVFSHASYLINLASPKEELRVKSIESMLVELDRGAALGLQGVVVHPGASVTASEDEGISLFQESMTAILAKYDNQDCQLLIENTAGQGTTLGRSIAQLGRMLQPFIQDERIGICIDSCHSHAAGYDLATADGLQQLIDELDQYNLLSKVRVIHLNDSKKPAGSRVDRHEHIGLGTIGIDGITRFIHHPSIRCLPLILETEKGVSPEREEWDLVNMRVLHDIAGIPYELCKEMN